MSELNNNPTLTDAQIDLIDGLVVEELQFLDDHVEELPNAEESIETYEAIQRKLGTHPDSATANTQS